MPFVLYAVAMTAPVPRLASHSHVSLSCIIYERGALLLGDQRGDAGPAAGMQVQRRTHNHRRGGQALAAGALSQHSHQRQICWEVLRIKELFKVLAARCIC